MEQSLKDPIGISREIADRKVSKQDSPFNREYSAEQISQKMTDYHANKDKTYHDSLEMAHILSKADPSTLSEVAAKHGKSPQNFFSSVSRFQRFYSKTPQS